MFGEELKDARRRLGLRLEDVRNRAYPRLQVSISTLSRWEQTSDPPTRDQVEVLDDILECNGQLLAKAGYLPHAEWQPSHKMQFTLEQLQAIQEAATRAGFRAGWEERERLYEREQRRSNNGSGEH